MKSQTILVAVLAAIGLWFVVKITVGLFVPNGGACSILVQESFESPKGTNRLVYEIKSCENNERVSSLSILDRDNSRSWITFLEVPSSFTNAAGVTVNPVSFGVEWTGEDFVRVSYPSGMSLEPWISSTGPVQSVEEFQHFETTIELLPSET